MHQLIRKKAVLERTALSNTSLYRLIAKGEFPKPIQLGPRAVAWVEDEIEKWIDSRISASR
ncbi:helix-turn-helix transcriptional regulator [Billgrantia sp. Q4P2]|uniref:helix-turn-helix transcriptional regulator n=1 Tax=Billgrantia sp. Q4P2 TaxID=3463857 RepID=UPI004055F00C